MQDANESESENSARLLLPATRVPGPRDLSQSPDDGPTRPLLQHYPVTDKGGRKRCFRSAWYQQYSWLEYSQITNSVYCFACRHFCCKESATDSFTVSGFQNWKKAFYTTAGFPQHDISAPHMSAMVAWCNYKQMKQSGTSSVQAMIDEQYQKQVRENREYVKTVAQVLLLTCTQNIAQRGHRESLSDVTVNPGNFRKILQLVVQHDPILQARFLDDNIVSRYTGRDIQNEIIVAMANMVRDQIVEDVKSSGVFSVIVDETKDCAKTEQLSIVLRYFAHSKLHESFLDFRAADGLDAQSLSTEILAALRTYGLDVVSNLVGQGYDGASVMSGVNRGVQQKIREVAPNAVYVHCYAHRLNLVVVDVCKDIPLARQFFALLERLYVFCSHSVPHQRWVEVQKQLYPQDAPRQLQRLSDTRWACRVVACRNIRDRLDALIETLCSFSESSDNADRSLETKGLLALLDIRFVLMLNMFCDLLGKVQLLSNQLQAKSVDLAKAAELVTVLRDSLQEARQSDEQAQQFFDAAQEQCNKCGIDVIPPARRTARLPRRFANAHVMETVGTRCDVDSLPSFKQNVYVPVVDRLLTELDSRFSVEANSVMIGCQALNPGHSSFLDCNKLEPFAHIYNINIEDLRHEAYQLRRLLERTPADVAKPTSLVSLVCFLEPYKLAFQEVARLLSIAVVLPVSSAACERSFSALKLIKTYLRSTMTNDRLSSVALLSIESTRAQNIDFSAFVDEFDSRHHNRKLLLH